MYVCFRLGGESLCVAQNTYAASWFKGKELNMVFGLQLSFSRVVSILKLVDVKILADLFILLFFFLELEEIYFD